MTPPGRFRHALRDGLFVRERPVAAARGSLLWLHGLGESGLCFEEVALRPEFRSYHLAIPDLPGYGRSPWPVSPVPLEALAEELAAWIARRSLPRPLALLGHSMGGVLAQLLVERHGDAAERLVDIDGNVTFGDCTFSAVAAEVDAETFRARRFGELKDKVYRGGLDDRALRGYDASLSFADPRTFHRHALDLVRLSRDGRLAERLARLPVPVLYVAGAPGGACAESRRRLAAAGVEVAEIAPSGHWPFIDRPRAFARAVGAFLARPGGR